ncbi:MAG TPA: signal peptidase I [Candidatus Eisenbacteria bacterium]|nr:signal peptidase I [Candidatus Eisenbacteria bacterium]
MPVRDGRATEVAAVAPPVIRSKSTVRELAEALAVALLLAMVIRTFIVQAFKIPSGSMLPTLEIGDHILVNKFIFGPRFEIPLTQISLGQLPGLREPRVGDVVVFIWPKDRSKDFIKRVVAVAGQTIQVDGEKLIVDGKVQPDPHAHFSAHHTDFGPFTVPAGHVFVMGDNRDQSYDSRFWGPVPIEDIKGLALVIYWSWGGDSWVRWDRLGRLVN